MEIFVPNFGTGCTGKCDIYSRNDHECDYHLRNYEDVIVMSGVAVRIVIIIFFRVRKDQDRGFDIGITRSMIECQKLYIRSVFNRVKKDVQLRHNVRKICLF